MRKFSTFIRLVKQSLGGEQHDYTKGSIRGAIILLAVPMILELSLESVFAVVDMFFVGHLSNPEAAIATVGLTEAVISLIYTIGIGLSIGVTAIVARRVGEKNFSGASKTAAQAILVSGIISIIIAILGVSYAPDILALMGAKPEVLAQGSGFTRIMFGSSPVIILLFLINGVFRGAGDATMAMKSLWIASGINIVLCPLLIYGLGPFSGFGLNGAALATLVGRTSGVVYQSIHLLRKGRAIQLLAGYFKLDFSIVKNIINVAAPATLQFFVQSGSWIVLTYLVSKTGSTAASAGYQIAIRNVVFFILPAWGLSNAAATLVGQNLGAKNPERAERSVYLTTQYNVIFMLLVTILFVFFSNPIVSLFTKEPEVQRYGGQALQIIGFGYILYGIGMVMIQSLNGAGDTKTPTYINIFTFWIFQIPFAWFLSTYLMLGPVGAFVAIPSAEAILACAAWYVFKRGKWKEVQI